jgi:hypothetical protein
MAAKQNLFMEKEKVVLIERTIHYHEIHIDFNPDFNPERAIDNDQFNGFFSVIAKLAQTKDDLRYQRINESLIFVQDVEFHKTEKIILGKLRAVRMDVFPEIMDIKTDIAKGIDAKETEGIVETTHFILNYSKKIKRIAIEHNQAGAKIAEFIRYCEIVGVNKGAINSIAYIPIAANNELPKFKKRIGKISNLYIRVHKDNIPVLRTMDKQIYTSILGLKDQYTTEYVGLNLSFDHKAIKKQDIKENIDNLLTSLIAQPKKGHQIEALEARAQDAENNYRMYTFDFLIDKLESKLKVQKKQKYRTIVSVDIFEKMKEESKEKFKNT